MAAARGGRGSRPSCRSSAEEDAAFLSELADSLKSAGDLSHVSGEWHPPSLASSSPPPTHATLQSLVRPSNRHRPPHRLRASHLKLVTLTPPIRLRNSLLTLVRDHGSEDDPTMDRAALQICFSVKPNTPDDEAAGLLVSGMSLIISEPLVVKNVDGHGRLLLVAASPREVLFSGFSSSQFIWSLGGGLRQMGNAFFKRKMYQHASMVYAEAWLSDGVSWSDKLAVLSNRSQAVLNMGLIDVAVLSADMALHVDPAHVKSLCRKAKGLMAGGEYGEALDCLGTAVSLFKSPEIDSEYERCRVFCRQSKTGDYQTYIRENLLNPAAAPACADYVGPVVVKAGQHGRGLFLNEDVKKGRLLLVSNPIAAVDGGEETVDDLIVELVRVSRGSSKAVAQLSSLACSNANDREVPGMELFKPNTSWPLAGNALVPSEGCCELPVTRTKMDVWKLRKIVDFAGVEGEEWSGVWGLPGFINHSCMENVTRSFVGRAMFVRAARDLSAGEELVWSYTCSAAPWLECRKDEWFQRWGFYCRCERCVVEQKYQRLLKQVRFEFPPPEGETAAGDRSSEVVARLEEALKSVPDEEEKKLIRAGYIQAYLNCRPGDLGKVRGCPSAKELLTMIRDVLPGIKEDRLTQLKEFCTELPEASLETGVEEEITALCGELNVNGVD